MTAKATTRKPVPVGSRPDKRPARVDGARLLYAYLQKDLLLSDVWLFQMLTARLIVDLGIWFPPAVYSCLPLLVPYAVRDSDSRGDVAHGIPDQWGSPNADGVFRDDNSLVKGIPRSLHVDSRRKVYGGARIDKGFVAAHVWRRLETGSPSTRERLTYSFVPNLVWLPAEVAKLTDREGSFVQAFVQAVAVKTYRDTKLTPAMKKIADPIWEMLPQPKNIPVQALPGPHDLNFFIPTRRWLNRRLQMIKDVVSALEVAQTGPLSKPIISSRYTLGLPNVERERLRQLHHSLDAYAKVAGEAMPPEDAAFD